MKATDTWLAAIFIMLFACFICLLGILLTGCGQDQEAPQPIIVNVTAPEAEAEPAATTAEKVVAVTDAAAEAVAEREEDPVVEEKAPAEVEDEPAEAPEVIGLLALAQSRMDAAMEAWNAEKQLLGNHEYLASLECLFILEQEHGWTQDETNEALDEIIDKALAPYADDVNALRRIFAGIDAFIEWLKEGDE